MLPKTFLTYICREKCTFCIMECQCAALDAEFSAHP
jgi:hypothetical protein